MTKKRKQLKVPTRAKMRFDGGLITYKDGKGPPRCLGDLMHFEGHGVYDPDFGQVDVTPEEAEAHNQALDKARIDGMDNQCQVGQGSYAYYNRNGSVRSFLGTLISDDVVIVGRDIQFRRGGRLFRGWLRKDDESFNFVRIL